MTQIDSDPFLHLLTDALRAGPGSAQWGEAVARLREGGVEGADEYKLLLRARENIESGRDYRAVRPGAGFTRKVLDGIDQDGGGRRRGVPMATIIAVVSGLVILGIVVTVLVLFTGGDPKTPQQLALERLEATSFSVAAASADFEGIAPRVPPGWRFIGQLGFDASGPLKVAASPVGEPGAFVGGGLVTSNPVPADRAGSIEAEIALPSGAAAGTGLTQVFVSDSADFSPDRATSPREIVWVYRDGRVTVDADGRTQGEAVNVGGGAGATEPTTVNVRITFDKDVAIVESGGRRLYAGPHGLASDAPRYAGVRFIRTVGEASEGAGIRSVNVAQSAPPAGATGAR